MGQTLRELAQQLQATDKKVQLIYAFNGIGKTRLSREFKELVAPKANPTDEAPAEAPAVPAAGAAPAAAAEAAPAAAVQPPASRSKILYYNAFTEDLFYWDNDLHGDAQRRLIIQPNTFTDWVLKDQGQDQRIVATFQGYTNNKLTPRFTAEDPENGIKAFSEVTFSMQRGDDESSDNLKISKGEESCFIWSIFYTLLEQVIEVLNDTEDRETNEFDDLEYVFIDDPVSSLDENHLIELAVDLAQLIKSSDSEIKFIITTHNPLFYNVLHNELKSADKYQLRKLDDGTYELIPQHNDSPFSYHLYLKSELEKAIESGQLSKFHFNFLRNILEKTSTFLGQNNWGDLLPKTKDDKPNPYEARIINISSHSKHASEEVAMLTDDDKRVLTYLVKHLDKIYKPELKDDQPA